MSCCPNTAPAAAAAVWIPIEFTVVRQRCLTAWTDSNKFLYTIRRASLDEVSAAIILLLLIVLATKAMENIQNSCRTRVSVEIYYSRRKSVYIV